MAWDGGESVMTRELYIVRIWSVLILCLLVWVCFRFGYISGKSIMKKQFHRELVDKGYAIYNPTNGVWQWK